jgi:FHA domain
VTRGGRRSGAHADNAFLRSPQTAVLGGRDEGDRQRDELAMTPELCQLKVTSPPTLKGMSLRIRDGRQVVGRAAASGLRIDHPDVSRTHAVIEHEAAMTIVEDMGSTNGTTVNGGVVDQPCELHHGDALRFGSVEAVFEVVRAQEAPTGALGWRTTRGPAVEDADRRPAVGAPARFDVDEQHGDWISNVGGNQYVVAERQSFLREIAAARSRARRIILAGFLLFLAGIAGQMWVLYQYSAGFERVWRASQEDVSSGQPDLPDVALRLAAVSAAAAMLGIVLMVTGLVLHVMATARRRRVDDQQLNRPVGYPLPGSIPVSHPGGPGGLQHRQPTGRRPQQRRW